MKKFSSLLAVLLAVLLLIGCGKTDVSPSTEPSAASIPETTVPAQTKAPTTETTAPLETEPVAETEPDYSDYYALLDASQGPNWFHDAMGCVFAGPENIDLYYFFYSGIPGASWDTVSEETAAWLVNQGFNKNMDLQVRPVDQTEEVMQTIFGISLSDVKSGIPSEWVYDEATDAYYTNKNDDWGIGSFEITWVEERSDGSVQIFYHTDSGAAISATGETFIGEPMMLMLQRLDDGSYRILGNMVVPSK